MKLKIIFLKAAVRLSSNRIAFVFINIRLLSFLLIFAYAQRLSQLILSALSLLVPWPMAPAAVWYTPRQGVLALANLQNIFLVYIMA